MDPLPSYRERWILMNTVLNERGIKRSSDESQFQNFKSFYKNIITVFKKLRLLKPPIVCFFKSMSQKQG